MMIDKEKKKIFDKEVKKLTDEVKKTLGEEVVFFCDSMGINIERNIRFLVFANHCKEARKQKRLSIKEIAKKLDVPKSDLKNIEKAQFPFISLSVLNQYVEYLGLENDFETWKNINQKVLKSFKPWEIMFMQFLNRSVMPRLIEKKELASHGK